jgi:hypothetical protein
MNFMKPYQQEKIDNAICYFAKEHKNKTHRNLTQTQLYKYLALLDFEAFEKRGRPVLGLEYKAKKRGPVPPALYDNRSNLRTKCYAFLKIGQTGAGQDRYDIIAHGVPNLDYFSKKEMNEMQRLIDIYADVFVTAGDMSDASHERIRVWRETWRTNPNGMIDYKLTFEKDPYLKKDSELTFADECYLVSKYIESC